MFHIQVISQPFISGFSFTMIHFEADMMLDPTHSNIFEYSNEQVDE